MITDDASGETWSDHDAAIHDAAMELEWYALGIECRLAKAREKCDKRRVRELREQLVAIRQAQRHVLNLSEPAYSAMYGKSRKDR